MFPYTCTCQLTYIHTCTEIDTQERTHVHVHRACLRAQENAPAISGPLVADSRLSRFPQFASCSIPNRKRTQRRPHRDHFWARIGSPPHLGVKLMTFAHFVNHMEMHACAHAYAHAHVHTYIFTPTSTHEMRTRTHVHKHCLRPYANAIAFLMQTLKRCLAALENGRRGPKAASSNFEHKPWKLRKWCKSDDRSALLKHRSFFRTTFTGSGQAANFGRQTALENEGRVRNGDQSGTIPGRSGAPTLPNLPPQFPH